jgi:hypothetical protein
MILSIKHEQLLTKTWSAGEFFSATGNPCMAVICWISRIDFMITCWHHIATNQPINGCSYGDPSRQLS